MKTNFNALLTHWRKRIDCAPVGSFLNKHFGGRIERRRSGWFSRAFHDTPWRKIDANSAAVSAAAYEFAHIKQARRILPLP